MSDMPAVAALLCEQGAALFPIVISVCNNTPMTLCRTGARIGVAPYASAKVKFESQPELAIFIKKVNAQALLHSGDPKEVYPIKVLQVATGADPQDGAGVQPDAVPAVEVPPAENLADGPAAAEASAFPAAGDPVGATQAKRATKKGIGA